jgi:protocatechuate 3,4-dioxygenase beta subunit
MKTLSRREAGGIFLALGGLAAWIGCGGGDDAPAATPNDSGTTNDTGTAATDSGASETTVTGWASGGTKSMTDKASYPDPFATAVTTCSVIATATEGPCTEAADQVRSDVSEGYTGLPVRLALRIIDASCKAISGAKVKIWHTQVTGSYSGDTPNPGMCVKDSADQAKHYFRGVQTTDANGVVAFDTCFPGWYTGRAIHIHFTVTSGSKSYTSQLIFDQTLITEIFTSHVDYQSFGQPDTPNATDMVVKGDLPSHTLDVARMTDGAMLASKQIAVSV